VHLFWPLAHTHALTTSLSPLSPRTAPRCFSSSGDSWDLDETVSFNAPPNGIVSIFAVLGADRRCNSEIDVVSAAFSSASPAGSSAAMLEVARVAVEADPLAPCLAARCPGDCPSLCRAVPIHFSPSSERDAYAAHLSTARGVSIAAAVAAAAALLVSA
jgi:hypothetical protein